MFSLLEHLHYLSSERFMFSLLEHLHYLSSEWFMFSLLEHFYVLYLMLSSLVSVLVF